MLILIQKSGYAEYPEVCPFSHADREMHICAHPHRTIMTKGMPCGYVNVPEQYEPVPACCPLIKHPLDGIRIEVSK